MLAAALLALTVAVPGVAAATGGGENPLSKVPAEFEPALEAAADELGISAGELKNSSRDELQDLVCTELDGRSATDIAAAVQDAIDNVPKEQLEGLSSAELALLEEQLPTLIAQLKSACAEGVAEAEGTSDDGAASDSDDDTPVPERVDAGAGGLTDATGSKVPVIFGAAFAIMFGVFGIALIGMRRRA